MAIVESKPNEVQNKAEDSKSETYYRVFPDIFRKMDYAGRSVDIEISLPGVPKENITLKALPEFFHVEGKRDQVLYTAEYPWGAEVVPEKTTAKYEYGLLRIHAVIRNPMDDAKQIAL